MRFVRFPQSLAARVPAGDACCTATRMLHGTWARRARNKRSRTNTEGMHIQTLDEDTLLLRQEILLHNPIPMSPGLSASAWMKPGDLCGLRRWCLLRGYYIHTAIWENMDIGLVTTFPSAQLYVCPRAIQAAVHIARAEHPRPTNSNSLCGIMECLSASSMNRRDKAESGCGDYAGPFTRHVVACACLSRP